jgi:hypothetical protein
MSKWQSRCVVYKIALVLLYFIFLVYALAFAIPTWIGFQAIEKSNFIGLWAACDGSEEGGNFQNCTKYAFGDGHAWMDGVRGLWLAGMFIYLVAVLYSLAENCCASEQIRDYGLVGALVILAGLCGAVGVIVMAIEVEEYVQPKVTYFWGYMLACITSGLSIILALILLITRNVTPKKKSVDNRTADYVFDHKQSSPYVSEYTNQGYSHNDIPLANGVTYHHTPTAHPYTTYQDGYNNNVPQPRSDPYAHPDKSSYGYYNGRPNQLHDPADPSVIYTDLSNGYTNELLSAEHTLSRSNVGQQGNFARPPGGDFPKQDFGGRNNGYMSGSRPY